MAEPLQPIEVAAGLVFKQGRLLIAQRKPRAHLGGLWEFPGGKREPGESLQACLAREIQEELELIVAVMGRYQTIEHRYPDKFVRLHFFLCRWESGKGRAAGCQRFEWIDRSEFPLYQFPEADFALVGRLMTDEAVWK